MDNKGITKFLEQNSCKTKQEIIKKLIKKFNLTNKLAEEVYVAWKKEYITYKSSK